VRFVQDLVGSSAGLEQALVVGVAFDQVTIHPLDAMMGDLCPCRIIEEDGRTVQCGELLADEIYV
jgi:hypothetical protein